MVSGKSYRWTIMSALGAGLILGILIGAGPKSPQVIVYFLVIGAIVALTGIIGFIIDYVKNR